MKLLIATNNAHKIEEIRAIIDELLPAETIELIAPYELSVEKLEPEETGETYPENAEIKAKAFFEKFNIPTIADDSGLEIDALDGAPGVISARFAGDNGNNKLNRAKVLELLKDIPPENKSARFRAVICFIDETEKFFVEGKVEGKLIDKELGGGGFGYDPLFIPNGFAETFSEMSDKEKNKISHRANAVIQLTEKLKLLGKI